MTGAGLFRIVLRPGSFVYRISININTFLHGEASAVRNGVIFRM